MITVPTNRLVPSLRLVRVSTKLRKLPVANTPVMRVPADLLTAPLYRGTRVRRGKMPPL